MQKIGYKLVKNDPRPVRKKGEENGGKRGRKTSIEESEGEAVDCLIHKEERFEAYAGSEYTFGVPERCGKTEGHESRVTGGSSNVELGRT